MLYHLGYLTIVGDEFGTPILKIANRVMKEIYTVIAVNDKIYVEEI